MFDKLKKSLSPLKGGISVDQLKSAASGMVSAASGMASAVADKGSDLKELSLLKLKKTVGEVVASMNLIRSVGFNPKGISVKLGLNPTVSIKVEVMNQDSLQDIENIISQTPSNAIKVLLRALGSMKQAHAVLSSIPGLNASEFDVTVGLSPSVGLSYKLSDVSPDVAALALAEVSDALANVESELPATDSDEGQEIAPPPALEGGAGGESTDPQAKTADGSH